IRYAGHCDKFKTMIDLGLCSSDPVDLTSDATSKSEPGAVATGFPAGSSRREGSTRGAVDHSVSSPPGKEGSGFSRGVVDQVPSSPPGKEGSGFSRGVVDASHITPRQLFARLLETHLPADGPDYVLVRLEF